MVSKRSNTCEAAIIGAGPYGLSVAAHLRRAGISIRLFGDPMSFWRDHMPKGMRLRSPWRATHLSDPDGLLSLDAFAAEYGTTCDGPLSLEAFIAYGVWFQWHVAPEVDRRLVRVIEPRERGFEITLCDDEVFGADRVIIATGLAKQDYRPCLFHDLPATAVTHSCEHSDFARWRGARVAVIGRGQSACESAALLAEAGAKVEIISRADIRWLGDTAEVAGIQPALRLRLRTALEAPSAVGPFPLNWLVETPTLVKRFPQSLRDRFTKRCLKAGATGWLKPRLRDVTVHAGRTIVSVTLTAGRVILELDDRRREFDHVVLGTGYRVDVTRLGLFAPSLLTALQTANGSPVLGTGFESSVPNLHFVGCYAVQSFGPLLRFVAGAPYAARTLAAALARRQSPTKFSRPPIAALPRTDGLIP